MLKCSEMKELISQYIDGELETEQRRELEAHTEACEECRNELMELMQIVGLCRNVTEEELPANFKSELHQKLLEVKEQWEDTKKLPFYQSKYFRLFSSVAAVFLLVFLIRGISNFDLFTGVQKSSANEMYDMMDETVAGNQIQMKSAAAVQEAAGLMDKNRAGYKDGRKADAEAPASGTEIDRSTTQDRDNNMHMAIAGVSENITRNSASITITLDEPELQAEKVRQTAKASSGLDQTDIESINDNYKYSSQEEGVILQLSIPIMQYDEFINALNRDYGQENVRTEAVVAEDMTDDVENLLYEVDKLDLMLEDAESENVKNSEEELVKIREQKAEIQNRIDSLRLESDLTNVEIKLKKK